MADEEIVLFIKTGPSLSVLSPEKLAHFTEYLIRNELRTGGPYKLADGFRQNILLNAKLYILFARDGKHLSEVARYVEEGIHSVKNPSSVYTTFKNLLHSADASATKPKLPPLYEEVRKYLITITPPHTINEATTLLARLALVDARGELTRLSETFARSHRSITKTIDPLTLELLGKANLYTWMAYSLYDDILDTDGALDTLPTAHIYHRLAYQTYLNAGLPPSMVQSFFSAVDTAHSEEVRHGRALVTDKVITIERLPEMALLRRLLGKRSIVHCLGPYALIMLFTKEGQKSRTLRTLFELYCAARQLNDDIHDWEDDLRHGRITYAVAWLLQAAKVSPGTYALDTLTETLRTLYWKSELDTLLGIVERYALDAEKGLSDSFAVPMTAAFARITTRPIITSAQKARKELADTKLFLKARADILSLEN